MRLLDRPHHVLALAIVGRQFWHCQGESAKNLGVPTTPVRICHDFVDAKLPTQRAIRRLRCFDLGTVFWCQEFGLEVIHRVSLLRLVTHGASSRRMTHRTPKMDSGRPFRLVGTHGLTWRKFRCMTQTGALSHARVSEPVWGNLLGHLTIQRRLVRPNKALGGIPPKVPSTFLFCVCDGCT